ncbi:TatD family hydrolase [Hyperthermus butylicus]|uniref:DNase n=1 Tax=Hyperthermus butylicus (strain DSM 5456 / JCM 9403 / PLM1-5) TaxID=415426 RepID=A2BM65_HYPBU|nr:TatD family hydrolase [Hyperthermus butylicus]ABM81076.1 putative DNase [Hyperthermus butylicus DSM 5456]
MVERVAYIDVHSHLPEYSDADIERILASIDVVIVSVGEDLESSIRSIEIAEKYKDRIYPCIGLHPWNVKSLREALDEAKRIVDLALSRNIKCLGEVGLDTKFVGETIELQREVFRIFLEAARDYKLFLNLHTAGTWEEVFNLLIRYDIVAANFHWYTGPLHLLKDIESAGYTISINPAVKIQAKHRNVVKAAPISIMLTESDSPYKYRSLELEPRLVADAVAEIAAIKSVEASEVKKLVYENFRKKVLSVIG